MSKFYSIFIFSCFLIYSTLSQPTVNIWPLPQTWTSSNEVLLVSPSLSFQNLGFQSQILKDGFVRYSSLIFSNCIAETEHEVSVRESKLPDLKVLQVELLSNEQTISLETNESYNLTVSLDGTAKITAVTVFGALHGLETFSQLVLAEENCNFRIEGVPWDIIDSPRFPHRGLLLDTSRNYYPVEAILRTLDGMSYTKLNVFHWHVVDSQSFPIQSLKYPMLSEKGAYSQDEIYTKQDIQKIVNYGLNRGIRVIPEFDTPGHTYSWGLSYPSVIACPNAKPWTTYCNEPPCGQLNPIEPSTYDLLEGFLGEMASWFSDDYIHLGSDEVNGPCWLSDPSISDWMKQHGVVSVSQLLAIFENAAHKIVLKNNKKPINWEEVITVHNLTLDKDTLIQVWLGVSSILEVVSKGYRVIDSAYENWYLDCGTGNWINGGKSWCDPYKTWELCYNHNPTQNIPTNLQPLIIGGESCLWSEQSDSTNIDQKIWPRASAVAERLWSPLETTGNINAALPRILRHRENLVKRGINATPLQPRWCYLNPGNCDIIDI